MEEKKIQDKINIQDKMKSKIKKKIQNPSPRSYKM